MYLVEKLEGHCKRVVARIAKPDDIRGIVDVHLIEEDGDHPDHWDLITETGEIYSLEPVK